MKRGERWRKIIQERPEVDGSTMQALLPTKSLCPSQIFPFCSPSISFCFTMSDVCGCKKHDRASDEEYDFIEFAAACRIFKDLGPRPSNWDLRCCKARLKSRRQFSSRLGISMEHNVQLLLILQQICNIVTFCQATLPHLPEHVATPVVVAMTLPSWTATTPSSAKPKLMS